MICPASDRCKKLNSPVCNELCYGYLTVTFQLDSAKIPKLYRKFRYYNIEIGERAKQILGKYCLNIVKNVESGYSLYLYGDNTTGKTATACAVLIEYLIQKALTVKQEPQGLFVVVPELLNQIRDSFNSDDYEWLLTDIKNIPLLVMDDIGSERSTEWAQEQLFEIINYRYSNNLATIYTSNVSVKMLEDLLGRRISSRLNQATKIPFYREE